jgi:hypothetical protein
LAATEDADGGGVHPNRDIMAMVFDMTTGAPVNWVAMVAKTAKASGFRLRAVWRCAGARRDDGGAGLEISQVGKFAFTN